LIIDGSVLPSSGLSGGPSLCQANPDGTPNPNQCYQPSKADSLAITVVQGIPILQISLTNLVLSVKATSTNPALTGNPRQITITNTGDGPATNLSISHTGLPTGTSIDTSPSTTCTTGSTLAVDASCTITINPGNTATSGTSNAACTTGIAPTPGLISITASIANTVSTNVVVLGYGCQYEEGFVYAIDDTTNNGITGTCSIPPCTGSIGGSVATLSDQTPIYPNGVTWGTNGSDAISYDIIPLIAEVSTPNDSYNQAQTEFISTYSNTSSFPFPASSAFATCNGAYDGNCNTSNILALYNAYITNYGIGNSPYALSAGPTNPTDYGAGLCSNYAIDSAGNSPCSTGTCYTNWYLPAICEMGYDSHNIGSGCGTLATPTLQNMQSSLVNFNNLHLLAGNYWSSTGSSNLPQANAWDQSFSSNNSYQSSDDKFNRLAIRCVRTLTF
jgi:hypothetical protein